ncbi:MAG TPA: protein-disulfide reductase DsbD domain-containing protein [Xanthobacteraceae bacterium]|nr:protein-disulfide reductase DsbD domain-containing protein [Xanthobacteraceae bacterium]
MVTVPARADNDASPWDGSQHAAIRLIAAGPSPAPTAMLRAGLELRLAPGWRTYWRYPGDAGVPPRFDFSGSQNAAQVTVLWPAPRELSEGDTRSIGYSDDVILPLRIVPRDLNKPVALLLKVDYAVCGQLCIPATGSAALTLPVSTSTHEAALVRSEARVPSAVAIGPREGLAITAVRLSASPRPQVMVDVAAPAAARVALFAEGPNPEWALPVPRAVPDPPPGLHRFAFDLEGLPQGASGEGAVIKLTAVSGDNAIEVDARLD